MKNTYMKTWSFWRNTRITPLWTAWKWQMVMDAELNAGRTKRKLNVNCQVKSQRMHCKMEAKWNVKLQCDQVGFINSLVLWQTLVKSFFGYVSIFVFIIIYSCKKKGFQMMIWKLFACRIGQQSSTAELNQCVLEGFNSSWRLLGTWRLWY